MNGGMFCAANGNITDEGRIQIDCTEGFRNAAEQYGIEVGHSADVCAHLEVVSRAADSVKRTLALHRLSLISGYLDLLDQCCVRHLRERYYTQAVRLMVDHTANDMQQHSADEDDAAFIAEETQKVWRRLAEYS